MQGGLPLKLTFLVPVALVAVVLAGCGGGGVTLRKQTLSYTERQNDDSSSFADNPPKSSPSNGDEPKLSPSDSTVSS